MPRRGAEHILLRRQPSNGFAVRDLTGLYGAELRRAARAKRDGRCDRNVKEKFAS